MTITLPNRRLRKSLTISAMLCGALLATSGAAFALSEIQKEETPAATTGGQPPATGQTPAPTEQPTGPAEGVAPPAGEAPAQAPPTTEQPATTQPGAGQPEPEQADPDAPADQPTTEEDPDKDVQGRRDVDPNAPPPQVEYDLAKLPEPVRRMRQLLIDAVKTGDPEKLRPLLGTGTGGTQLSLTDQNDDPVKFLMSQSGDQAGQEILAILEEVLDAGYVHLDAGTPEELYVWPYFFAYPLDKLTPQQKVEIYKIVTASDFDEMQAFGTYIFYRIGIAPDGRWAFFVAGE